MISLKDSFLYGRNNTGIKEHALHATDPILILNNHQVFWGWVLYEPPPECLMIVEDKNFNVNFYAQHSYQTLELGRPYSFSNGPRHEESLLCKPYERSISCKGTADGLYYIPSSCDNWVPPFSFTPSFLSSPNSNLSLYSEVTLFPGSGLIWRILEPSVP